MALQDDIAEALSQRVISLIDKTGDEKIEKRISDEIGTSSPTLQEAFNTAMRFRKAELRALRVLDMMEQGQDVPAVQISAQPQDDGGH